MNRIIKTMSVSIAAIMLIAACGNASAQNDKKNTKSEKSVKELNAVSFSQKVFNVNSDDMTFLGDKPVIVDFTATWCGPCQRIAPILEELAVEYGGKIDIYKVDIDKNRALAEAFNVSSIPAVLYIPANGEEPVMTVGARGKEKFMEEISTILLQK